MSSEAQRQQQLLAALWRDGAALPTTLRGSPAQRAAGLAAYRGNAAANAERALAVAYPTVLQLVGADNFAALARDLWRAHPPRCGDLGEWSADLPELISGIDALAVEAYLADSARLDWLVHGATRASDGPPGSPDLALLAKAEADAMRLVLRPGAALLASRWPVVAIWAAHEAAMAAHGDRFAAVREAMQAGLGERAFVCREGFAVRVFALDAGEAGFTLSLLAGVSVAAALDAAGADFSFDAWLVRALRSGWLVAVLPLERLP